MIRRQNREQRAAALRQQAAASERAISQAAARSREILAANAATTPVVYARTTRFIAPNGFTIGQLGEIAVPAGARRVQLVISDPGYGKHGYRSTGWISTGEFDLDEVEDAFGVNPGDIRSIVYDTGG